ncbi:MAG: hypothetical protein ABUL43_02600 [Hyphomicrobium sp.]
MENEIFESSVRSIGDLAGVFEYDGDNAYFFLFDLTKGKGRQASAVICVNSEKTDYCAADISIKWNRTEEIVGLYVHGTLAAAFDHQGRRFGGDYGAQKAPTIPDQVIAQFR